MPPAPEAPQAPVAPEVEVPKSPPPQSTPSPQVQPKPVIQYVEKEPSLSSLRIKAEKEKELAEAEAYWRKRFAKQEREVDLEQSYLLFVKLILLYLSMLLSPILKCLL